MESRHPEIFSELREKKTIDDASAEKLNKSLDEFQGVFSVS
jgi:hypothetical protein